MTPIWRYDVGAFHSPSDFVVLANAPVGTFSTGQHGFLGKHRLVAARTLTEAFGFSPRRRRRGLERGLAASR